MISYRGNFRVVSHLDLCRRLRGTSTDAEHLLWRLLRGRHIQGTKFRRQHQYGPYILDFLCPEQALCIEADGSGHLTADGTERDAERTRYLEVHGNRVFRFTNEQILRETEAVIFTIWSAVGTPSP